MRGVDRRADDSGTIAVLLAVLLTLFLTVVSLVVDVGRLYDEHGQLAAGADAAALAVAAGCTRLPDQCTTDAPALVQQVVADNARDHHTRVEDVAISGDGDRGTVTVRTRSLDPGGGDVPLSRPRASGDEAIVRAAATAAWGPVGGATTIPLAISLCDWNRAMANQGGHHTGPAPSDGTGTVVLPHEPDPDDGGDVDDGDVETAPPPTTCSIGGVTMPTGFVELDGGTGCEVTSSWDRSRWLEARSRASFERLESCLVEGAVVAVPVFDVACQPEPTGCRGRGQVEVRLVGYGAVIVTGWRLPSGTSSRPPTCPPEQRPPARCISGVVTRTVLPGVPVDTSGPGPTPLGVSAVQLMPTNP